MRVRSFFSILFVSLFLSGCLTGKAEYEGLRFPKTTSSQVVFQENRVPADCTAFAHLLMSSRAGASGKDIGEAMQLEAENKGANFIFVGMARKLPDENLKENLFDYYGPDYAYNFSKTWLGLKFGFRKWNNAGELVGLGADCWISNDIKYDNSLLIQAVFLRCGEE